MVASSNTEGTCYIQTSSLDGEKNLKKRKIPKDLEQFVPQGEHEPDLLTFAGECEAEEPSNDLY